MSDIFELADRFWRGDVEMKGPQAFGHRGELAEIDDAVAFVPSFANVTAVRTDDGLVLVDTGSAFFAAAVHEQIRSWTASALNTAVYSHGHIDHVFGVAVFEEEAKAKGWTPPRVIAHEALSRRFDRYKLTAGFNEIINQRQFQLPGLRFPTEFRYPDETYAVVHSFDVGDERFELHHAKGETDDHTWTWIPSRKILCCGDFFIWASPNAGNPQKVQRYPKEWANALREMAALTPEVLLPGHGFPVVGAGRVHQALTDAADMLDHLHDETVRMMNAGARLDEIVHTVKAPEHLLERPYLKPVYDEPEFVVRNVWRLYGGWYDGNPAHLKSAPDRQLAEELATLAGGAQKLADRAVALASTGADRDLRLAGHLAELAALAAPDDAAVHAARAEVFERRVEAEASTMSKGVFSWAAKESRERRQ